MRKFMNFIEQIKQKEKLVFVGKVCLFYVLMLLIWFYFMLSKDSSTPAFIYEQF